MLLILFSLVSISSTPTPTIRIFATKRINQVLSDQGQGAGVAIEDAASLAVVLPADTSPEEVPERLRLYQEFRYDRANRIQEFSRQAGKDKPDKDFDSQ